VQAEHLVDQAEVAVVEVRPHQQRDEAGDRVRHDQHGAVEAASLQALVVEDHGESEAEREGEQHRAGREHQGPHEGREELPGDGSTRYWESPTAPTVYCSPVEVAVMVAVASSYCRTVVPTKAWFTPRGRTAEDSSTGTASSISSL